MVVKSKNTKGAETKKPLPKKRATKAVQQPGYKVVTAWFAGIWHKMLKSNRQFLARRPHRSFQLTRRRDYTRSLAIEGYVAFTLYVTGIFRKNWRMFCLMAFIYAFIMVLIGAATTQDTYATIDTLLKESTDDFFGGGAGKLGQAGIVVLSAFVSSPANLQPTQMVYMIITLIFAWLATVWLLRELLLNRKPKLRDGLYNSGAPILSFLCVVVVIVVQMIPIGLTVLAYAALSSLGAIDSGLGSMLFWLIAAVIIAMVMYWITSSIIALVVVTLPGMYPLRALKLSGDLVVGRRLRVMFRLLWGAAAVFIVWALFIICVILLDNALKTLIPAIAGWPVVPYIGALSVALGSIWYASYVYLFYRKVVDDNAKPA